MALDGSRRPLDGPRRVKADLGEPRRVMVALHGPWLNPPRPAKGSQRAAMTLLGPSRGLLGSPRVAKGSP